MSATCTRECARWHSPPGATSRGESASTSSLLVRALRVSQLAFSGWCCRRCPAALRSAMRPPSSSALPARGERRGSGAGLLQNASVICSPTGMGVRAGRFPGGRLSVCPSGAGRSHLGPGMQQDLGAAGGEARPPSGLCPGSRQVREPGSKPFSRVSEGPGSDSCYTGSNLPSPWPLKCSFKRK